MKVRVYSFVTGIETATQPDAGTPSAANDIVTKSYVDGLLGTEIQEQLTGVVDGVNVTFTASQTPLSAGSFKLYRNGVLLRVGTHYTRSGVTVTMITPPVVGQDLDAVYRY